MKGEKYTELKASGSNKWCCFLGFLETFCTLLCRERPEAAIETQKLAQIRFEPCLKCVNLKIRKALVLCKSFFFR